MRTELNQYILVRITPDNNKIPCSPEGQVSNALDPSNWLSYDEAHRLAEEKGLKVAFVLTENDPYFCVDIDHCLLPSANGWNTTATNFCGMFNEAYMEVSVSGTGLHIWGRADKFPPHGSKNVKLGVEFYHEKRFIVLGTNGMGDPETDFTAMLPAFLSTYFQRAETQGESAEWTSEPVPEWSAPEDDDELIERMLKSRSHASVFGGKTSLRDLWLADEEAIGRAYPASDDRPYDASSADAALAQHLAFWTGKNCERIARLMNRSLLKRDKWERDDYLPRTILRACSIQKKVAGEGNAKQPTGHSKRMAGGFVSAAEFPEVFANCVYIYEQNAVLVENGALLKQEQFKVKFGGFKFITDDQARPIRNAWEAFTNSPSWRPAEADSLCFRPEHPPLAIIEEGGMLLANTYVPVDVPRATGDISRFLKMLETTYEDPRDREILLSYLAAVVQYKGRKFGWAPLLQGPEGNGKSFLGVAVTEAIGPKYCHSAKASELVTSGSKFNSWLENKIFITVEDMKVNTPQEMEVLKPLLTDERVEIQGKGKNQYMGDNRANFLFTSNHTNALRINEGSRRYAPLMAAQQTPAELLKAGLTPSFYADLWDWARGRNAYAHQPTGFSMIAEFLHSYEIKDEFNPATEATRAPKTSRWEDFVASSLGQIEQEIMEAVESCRPGFAGGWVSSIKLDQLLQEKKMAHRVSHQQRVEILHKLGYIPHPALPNGRATSEVLPDVGRPRLFVVENSLPHLNYTSPRSACEAYSKAQVQSMGLGSGMLAQQTA